MGCQLPNQGSNPGLVHWNHRVLDTDCQASPSHSLLKENIFIPKKKKKRERNWRVMTTLKKGE